MDDAVRPARLRSVTTLEERLAALGDAAKALAGALELDTTLDTIVRSAVEVTGAHYAALGVLGDDEHIQRFFPHGIDEDTVRRIGHYPTGKGLLGVLIRDPQTLRLDDMSQHPASSGFPPEHPPMTAFLGTTVSSHGRVFGNLYLTDKPGGFDATDEAVIEVLAAQAGAAIETASLSQRLRELAVADERERISRELHDGVIQWLFSIGMGLEAARTLLPEEAGDIDERLSSAVDGLDGAIRELRGAIFRLRPQQAASLGLAAGITELAREYEVNALIRPSLEVPAEIDAEVPVAVVADALQVIRESLSNAARHAQARNVHIAAVCDDERLEVSVRDDGVGFQVDDGARVGHGLANMRERASALGAELTIDSTPGAGTAVRLSVPLEQEATSP